MSKSTKSCPVNTHTYTRHITELACNSVNQPITLLPDGTTLVKLDTKEVINYAMMKAAYEMSANYPRLESRTHADEHSVVPTRRKSENPRPRLKSGLMGKKTETMAQQLSDLQCYILDHPIDECHASSTINARAAQYWSKNRKSLEAAAKKAGEAKGYTCVKSLAGALRNVRAKQKSEKKNGSR